MPKFAANLSWLFQELPFLDRFAAARAAGFEGVECLFPYEFDPRDLAARLQDNGLVQVLHNMPGGDWARGERGIAVLQDRVEEFRAGVRQAIGYATALGCPQVNCLAGIAPLDSDPQQLHDTFVSNLAYAANELGKAGLRLLIEPINTRDIPGFFLTYTRQAAGIIQDTGSDNIFIQYDIYHMQVMEGDLARNIAAHLPQIGHMQMADNPGRHQPGTGEINYPFLFGFVDQIGYAGWIGAEYQPQSTTQDSFGWLGHRAGLVASPNGGKACTQPIAS